MALVEDGALLGSRQLDMGNSGSEESPRAELADSGLPANAVRSSLGTRRGPLIGMIYRIPRARRASDR